jgi:GT2 family glycosyltransferase
MPVLSLFTIHYSPLPIPPTTLIFAQNNPLALPPVAVVILNYNGRKHLENFLPSVIASTYGNLRVIVADNASTDDSLVYVRENFPAVEILTHTANEGFAGGYNWALKEVDSEYYVLLNSDVSVTPGWIEPIIRIMEEDRSVAASQPKLLSYHQPQLFEYAGAAGGWIDKLGYPFSRGRIFDICEMDDQQYDTIQPIFWASGAAMFVRAAVFHELDGFDASFFAHQEEIDLCWRMQLAGYRIMACPLSVVYHVGAGTLPRGGRKVYLNFRNNLFMLCKNLPWQEKIWKLPLRIGLDAISAWKGLLSGDTDFFIAIYQAHIAVLKRLFVKRKKQPYPLKPLSRLGGVYHGSVVWQYFIKRHTRFQEIIRKKAL